MGINIHAGYIREQDLSDSPATARPTYRLKIPTREQTHNIWFQEDDKVYEDTDSSKSQETDFLFLHAKDIQKLTPLKLLTDIQNV